MGKQTAKALGWMMSAGLVILLSHCAQEETPFNTQDAQAFASGLTGRVLDGKGHGVTGALVTVLPGGATTVSGENGRFELGKLAPGAYRVNLSKADYRDTAAPDSIRLGLMETRSLDSLDLRYRYAAVLGKVQDSAGTPQYGAGVTVQDQDVSYLATNGTFYLSRIEPGRVKLFTALAGAGYGSLDTILAAGDTLRGVTLAIRNKGGTVTGKIVDAQSNPVSGATVSAVGGAIKTRTATDGSFTLPTLPRTAVVTVSTGNGDKTVISGVSVPEGGSTDLAQVKVSKQAAVGVLPTLLDGLAFGVTTDSLTLIAKDTASDTLWRIRRYLWSLDGGGSWRDSTATSVLRIAAASLGSAGTYPVKVKARLYRIVGTNALDSSTDAATISVRLSLPPDRTPPRLTRVSPLKDTTILAWADSSVSAEWTVTDDRRLDTAILDDLPGYQHGSRLSRAWNVPVGTTTVRAWARDSSGNTARDSVVFVRKALAFARLGHLSITGTLSPSFDSTVTSYVDSLDAAATTVELIPLDMSTGTQVAVNGTRTDSGMTVFVSAKRDTVVTVAVSRPGAQASTYVIRIVHRTAAMRAGDGVLAASLSLQSTTLYPALQCNVAKDFSKGTAFAFDLLVPKSSKGNIKIHPVVKTGSAWFWNASGMYCTPKADSTWMTCSAPLSDFKDKSQLGSVKSVTFQFMADANFEGQVWINNIRLDEDTLWNFDDGKSVFAVDDYDTSEARCVRDLSVQYPGGTRTLDTLVTLHSLSLDSGALTRSFDSTVLSYTDSVTSTVKSLKLTATSSSSSAVVKVNGTVVTSGTATVVDVSKDTTVTIVVSSPNTASTKTYSVRVVHKAANTQQDSGMILAPLTSNNDANGVVSTNMSGYSGNANLYQVFDGNFSTLFSTSLGVTSGYVSVSIPDAKICNAIGFFVPANNIYINAYLYDGFALYGSNDGGITFVTITSKSGMSNVWRMNAMNYFAFSSSVAYRTYKVLFTGVNHDNLGIQEVGLYYNPDTLFYPAKMSDTLVTLHSLSLDLGSLGRSFDSTLLTYTDSVASTVKSLKLTATGSSSSAVVTVNGTTVASGTATVVDVSKDTTVTIVVSSPNTASTKTYSVRVVHKAAVVDTTYGIPWNDKITYGVLHDARDGQEYRTVKIGTQTWMAENLNLRNATGSADTVGVCYNNSADSCAKYGRLYKWSTAMGLTDVCDSVSCSPQVIGARQGACPSGWHVPNKSEWDVLISNVGGNFSVGSGNEGAALKAILGWLNGNGSDLFGFRGIPSGLSFNGLYDYADSDVEKRADFWVASEFGSLSAWHIGLNSGYANVYNGNNYGKKIYISLRCIEGTGSNLFSDTLVTLHSLSLDLGSLGRSFDSTLLTYTDSVASTVKSLKLTATSSSSSAVVKVNGTTVASGTATVVDVSKDTSVTIVVSNPNTTSSRTYSVRVVHKASTGNNLTATALDLDATWNQTISTYDTFTDTRDGHLYRTVKIGSQVWLAENLNYRNSIGGSDTVGVCYNNSADSCAKYGRLYTWSEVMNISSAYSAASWGGNDAERQGICPTGWHLANYGEWKKLSDSILNASTAGTQLKATLGWSVSGNGLDAYGFRVLPAGLRSYFDKSFLNIGIYADFWSASENDAYSAWHFGFDDAKSNVVSENNVYGKTGANSLRCIKN